MATWSTVCRGLLLMAVCAGCSGNTDSDSIGIVSPGPGGSSNLNVLFTPDQSSPGSLDVSLAEITSSGDRVTLALNVTGVSGLVGAAFDVTYDASHLTFVAPYEAGSATPPGQTVYSVVDQGGRIVVGLSVIGGGGVDVSGTDDLIRLTFEADESGSSIVGFGANPDLLSDQSGNPPIAGTSWYGGTVVAN